MGGAIRIFSQQPKGDDSGYIEATGGDYNRAEVRGAIDVSLVPDKLFLRLTGADRQQDGWVQRENFACLYPSLAGKLPTTTTSTSKNSCNEGTLGDVDRYEAKAQLKLVISNSLQNNFSIDFGNDQSGPPADTMLALSTVQNPNLTSGTGVPPGTPTGLGKWLTEIGGPVYGLKVTPTLLKALQPNSPYTQLRDLPESGIGQSRVPDADAADQLGAPIRHVR